MFSVLSNIESENRYVVKSAGGETLFVGSETSSAFQRFCCGSGRSFEIHLFDPTQQEAFILKRRLACNVGILSCYLQVSYQSKSFKKINMYICKFIFQQFVY